MKPFLQLLPLLLLLAVAAIFIRRGARPRPDPERNKPDIGGGSGGSHTSD